MEIKELNEALEGIKAQVEKATGANKEALQGEIKALETKVTEAIENGVKSATEALQLEIKAVQDHADAIDVKLQGNFKPMEVKADPIEELKGKSQELSNLSKGIGQEVELKALVTRAGAIGDNAAGFFLPEIGQLGHKERSLYNVLPKVLVSDGNHSGTIRYRDWDEDTKVRAAAMIAEGEAFPESTAKWQWYTKDLKKVGDTIPVTEEFFEDERQAYGELDMFLNVNVNLVIDNQIVNGDNVGNNLDGLINTVPAYTAVASGIPSANLKDLSIKVRNAITRERGSKYRPDMIAVSSSTMEDLVLAKDDNNNYIFDENTGTLGGLSVVVDENMPDNQIVIGDRRYARIYEKGGVVLSKGTPNNQFNEDEMTLKARKRLLLLVREVDKTGFLKVTDVDAALLTLSAAQ